MRAYLIAATCILVNAALAQPPVVQHTISPELQKVVERFVEAVDHADVETVAATYSPEFLNVRVSDDGGFVQLTAAQILGMLKPPGATVTPGAPVPPSVPTKDTVIHHAEIIGDMGYVLMTRVKNLGNGWEPMYYSLVWRKRDGKWELLREFVHQRTIPKRH